jgi:glycosyltransferase involved in cell wall biosynthesis
MPEPAAEPEALTVALISFNQANVIEKVLAAWSNALEKLGRPYEILLVDDGSTDGTADRLDALAARHPSVTVHRHPERRGVGAAIRTALGQARFPLFFYTDCDYPYPAHEIKTFVEKLDETDAETGHKPDLVSGFRAGRPVTGLAKWAGAAWRLFLGYGMGIPTEPPPGALGGRAKAYALLVRFLFGVRVADVNSAFKLFRRKVFDRIPVQSDGRFVHAEILAKANFLGCLMDEVPIKPKPGAFPANPPAAEPPGRLRREMLHVFQHPDFGPPVLPTPEPTAPITPVG